MKKSTKILSLLMALVMIFSLTTVALADDNVDVSLGRTKLADAELEKVTPSAFELRDMQYASPASKDINEMGYWQRLPRNTLVGYGTVTPVNYAIPEEGSVQVSNPDIIGNCEFSLSYWNLNGQALPSLQFSYKALKTGTTTVTLTYFYNYGLINLVGGCTWYKETATFTVTVSDVETAKPDKPTVSDVERFRNYVNTTSSSVGAVYMWCDTTYDHHAWFDYITGVDAAYTLGDVVANDGSVLSKSTYPWVCVMTLDANKYLDAYNDELKDGYGTHYLKDGQAATESVTWYYNANLAKWQYRKADAPVYIDITHNAPAATEYTVTYTDGVNGTAFADQTYTVKDGEATPAFNGTPEREGYVFLGWEPEVAETVTGNATYTAQWEEALTEVKVTANKGEGALLFLGSEIKVTVKTNVKADNIKIVPNLNGALKQVASSTADDGTKTIWYRVTKIIGNYTTLSFTATATKGNQPSVTDTLTFGVNLRNRIHVVVDQEPSNVAVVDASLRLMHKYPQWNACPSLKFDAAKGEYVMKNAWDLSNQEFTQLEIKVGDKTYYVDKTKDGENLFDVIRDGTKEIYVNYTIVAPIKVTVVVNGETVGTKEFDGNKGDVLNYGEWSNTIVMNALTGKTLVGLTTTGLNAKNQAVFGETTEVVINVVVADNN